MLSSRNPDFLTTLFNSNPPMNYTSATGSSVHQTASLIMVAKPLDVIIGQPTTF
jgi:hypothetical protein